MTKQIITLIVILIVLAGSLIYLWLSRPEEGSDFGEEYIVGSIYDISTGRILVAEGIREAEYTGQVDDFQGNAAWFWTTETPIFGIDGAEQDFNSLQVGQTVSVWVDSPVLLSYPAQATASKIKILAEADLSTESQNCYVGGCGGELCTADPEAISDCEYLLGMECLAEASCQLVEGECAWVLNLESAECFVNLEREHGAALRETRIGYLFEEANRIIFAD